MAVASQFSRHDTGSLKISTQLNDLNLGSRAIKSHVTLLSRQYHYVLPLSFLTYAILQYYIGSVSSICSTFREPVSETADTVYYCAAACFLVSGFQQVVKIATFKSEELGCMSRSIFMAALTVNMIAGSSSYLTGILTISLEKSLQKELTAYILSHPLNVLIILIASAKYGGICEDMLGVESVCGQWAEWLISVPLIVYMTIAVEDKKSLGWEDFVIIGSCFLCVFCGFLLTLAQESSKTGFGLLLLSIGAVCVSVTFLSYSTGAHTVHEIPMQLLSLFFPLVVKSF